MRAAGFPALEAQWKPLLDLYKLVYWESSLGLFVSDLDPAYPGELSAYDLDARPEAKAAVESFQRGPSSPLAAPSAQNAAKIPIPRKWPCRSSPTTKIPPRNPAVASAMTATKPMQSL